MPLVAERSSVPVHEVKLEEAPISTKTQKIAEAPDASPVQLKDVFDGHESDGAISEPVAPEGRDLRPLSDDVVAELRLINNRMLALADKDSALTSRPPSAQQRKELAANNREVNNLKMRLSDIAEFQNASDSVRSKGLSAFLENSAKDRAAVSIQRAARKPKASPEALAKGQAVRNQTVMPSEIKGFLESNLSGLKTSSGGEVNLDDLSQALAREVLSAAQDPKSLEGNGKRLFEKGANYSFPQFDAKGKYLGKTEVKLPVGLWAKMAKDGKSIELEMVGQKLASGGFKDVFRSRPLKIGLQTPDHPKTVENAVLLRAKPGANKRVIGGVKALQDAFTPSERKNPDLRIAGELTHTDRTDNSNSGWLSRLVTTAPIEARDVEYRGDLDTLTDPKITPGRLSVSQEMQVISDVAQTLQLLHDKGLVHGDIKPGNILVSNGDPRGFVSDFDSLQRQGRPQEMGTEGYLDQIATKKGLQTSFTDNIALAKVAAVYLFGSSAFKASSEEFAKHADSQIKARVEGLLGKMNFSPEKGADPLQTLESINRDGLNAQTLVNLDTLTKQTQAMTKAKDSIKAVLAENEETLAYLKANPKLLSELQGTDAQAAKAMRQLNTQFPGFASLNRNLSAALKQK